jgi:hypothetical protein
MPYSLGTRPPLVTRRLTAEKRRPGDFLRGPIDTPGWRPYYNVIAAACANLGITMEVEHMS